MTQTSNTINAVESPVAIVEVITAGPQGPTGPAGPGVAAGGTTGQVLTKNSATDYDTTWSSFSAVLTTVVVRNNSGVTIPKGAPVYVTGSSGTTITVALADASLEATAAQTLGLAQAAIGNNANGIIVAVGELTGLDTSTLTEGAIVWLSETTGALTTTRPTQPAHGVVIGYCVKQGAGTSGIIYVKVDNGLELMELHDVLIASPASGQVLRRASDGLWKNAQLSYTDLSGTPTLGTAAALNSGTSAGNVPVLDGGGKITSAVLPSYVDDVIEAANFASLPSPGETGKIYVTLNTNKTYRWSGSAYIEIASSPASTDAVPEGTTNLYYTNARASAAAPVQSVAGRTGSVTLSSGDVSGLGTAATRNVGTTVGTVAAGDDARLATNLSYTASTRALASSTGTGATLPLFTSTDPGLTPLSGGGTTNFLRADGTWAVAGGLPGGATTQIQFNDGGTFAGNVNLTWNKTTNLLTVGGDVSLNDGGTFITTLQTVTPTANRVISLPNATGTVALVAGSSGQLIWNNAGAYAGVSTTSVDGSGNITLSARYINSTAGAASAPPESLTGTWFTGGTGITTKPQFLIEPTGTTSTAWSTSGTGLGVNAASGFTGRLLDLQVNGTTKFNITYAGDLTSSGNGTFAYVYASRIYGSSTDIVIYSGSNPALALGSGTNIFWESNATITGNRNVGLVRLGNGLLAVNDGGVGISTNFRDLQLRSANFVRTYTDASNYEQVTLDVSTNTFTFGPKAAGTGVLRPLYVSTGSTTVANLISASTAGAGARAFVTDATATTFLSTVAGGGANKVPVVSDGTNWLIG